MNHEEGKDEIVERAVSLDRQEIPIEAKADATEVATKLESSHKSVQNSNYANGGGCGHLDAVKVDLSL